MARSIISGGAPVAVTRKLIRNGVAVAVSAALLSGGAWVDVDTPQQQIEPFTIGTLDFAVASLDSYLYGSSVSLPYAVRMFATAGESVSIVCDAAAGTTISYWSSNILPVILARAGTENLVVSLLNPIGNDITNAVSTYGRADAAPNSYYEDKISILADGVAQLQAAGFKVIVGNVSYRNYGIDDSCRTDENKGSFYVNENFLNPWIRDNMPECWNIAADRPMLDVYNYVWNLGNWFFDVGDQTHPNYVGIAALRRHNFERIHSMSHGIIPSAIPKRSWPFTAVGSSDVDKTVTGFGIAATLDGMPANINRAIVDAGSTINTHITFPGWFVDSLGNASPITMESHGWYSYATNARGNTGDTSVSLTNNYLLKGNAYLGSTSSNNRGTIEIGGLTPNGSYTVGVAASALDGTGVKIGDYYVSDYPTKQQIDPETALPADFLTFNAVADSLGFVYVVVFTPAGSSSSYLSGISIESAA